MANVYLILGSNEGHRIGLLEKAKYLITEKVGKIEQRSKIYVTEPWGVDDQPSYYNQVLQINTSLEPQALMVQLLKIEEKLGRLRSEKYAIRTMDIDILFYDHDIINTDRVTIPHPRLHERRFVLEPLNELASELIHPIMELSIRQLLINCIDQKEVTILDLHEPANSI